MQRGLSCGDIAMKKILSFFLAFGFVLAVSGPSHAQKLVDTEDPRQLALDIYSNVNRAAPPASIAVRLQTLVRVFRYRCTRLTDYQVFTQRTNIIDFKVKCSGDSLYGVTVASNGYVSVYGGNGIISSFNRTDGLIFIFDNEGDLAGDRSLTVEQAVGETVDRLELEDEVNVVYVMGTVATMLGFLMVFGLIWWRAWKYKQTRKPRQRMKPMSKHRVSASSNDKDVYLEESEEVAKNVFKHPRGFFIARGKRGKRRFFSSAFWARVYATRGWRLFEISAPKREVAESNPV